jgi:predicted Zn finger-like uncharacterized protein
MKFVCDRCQTKYSIADEKVRGKILKVRCKSCANIITVREEGVRRATGPSAAVGAAPVAAASSAGSSGVRAAPVAAQPSRPPVPPAVERRAVARPPAEPPPADDGVTWYMALEGNRSGPFSRKQLIEKLALLPKDADLHVWNERLGSWKPPLEVPALAMELNARRRAPTPVPAAPAGPPPFPGAPRRPSVAAPPLAAAPPIVAPSVVSPPLAAAARASAPHPVVGSPIAPGVGLKLPPPTSPPGGRRPTGPLAHPAGHGAAATALAPHPAHEASLDIDPSTLLETPSPEPHMLHGLATHGGATNGVSHAESASASNGTSGSAEKSDILNTLNLASASASHASPRLLSSEAVVGWEPGTEAPAARQRSTRIVIAFLGVIAIICVVLMFNVLKKPKLATSLPPPKSAVAADPLAAAADVPNSALPSGQVPPTEPAPAATPPEPPARGHGKARPVRGHAAGPASASPTAPPPQPASPAAPAAEENGAAARYRDNSRPNMAITAGGGAARPAPTQGDITRVINNNRGGIKNCYQRALLRDSSLTHGKISVKVNIGISGRVKRVGIDGPPQFRSLDPCIKEVVGRWAFPQGPDEYETEFVYVFQGNE